MTPTEIVTADSKKQGIDPKKVMSVIHQEISKKKGFLFHENNSLLYGRYITPHVAEVHLMTEDSPLQLMQSLKLFISHGQRIGIKKLYGKADNPGILKFLKSSGLNVLDSNIPMYNWMALL